MTVRRPPVPVGGALSSVGLLMVLGLVGCTGAADEGAGAGTSAPSSTSAPAASTSAGPGYALPSSCTQLVTIAQIQDAVGTSLAGETRYVVGEAQPSIGRTGRITCGFGVTPATDTTPAGPPLLEASVFTYTDAAAAADRIGATVEAQQAQGVRADSVALAGCADSAGATVLTSAVDVTALCSVRSRTYSLTFDVTILGPDQTTTVVQALLADVLANDAPEVAASAPTSASAGTGSGAPGAGSTTPATPTD